MEKFNNYQYDVFISYPQYNLIKSWLSEYFFTIFFDSMFHGLGREPKIFVDKEEISSGDSLNIKIQQALATSKTLLPIWSPMYFHRPWCRKELNFMLKRERLLGYRTNKNSGGLILPIVVGDGKHFPEPIKDITYRDFRDYFIDGDGFRKSEKYMEFQSEVREWTEDIVSVIQDICPWNKEWLDDDFEDNEELSIHYEFSPPYWSKTWVKS